MAAATTPAPSASTAAHRIVFLKEEFTAEMCRFFGRDPETAITSARQLLAPIEKLFVSTHPDETLEFSPLEASGIWQQLSLIDALLSRLEVDRAEN